MAPLPLEGLCFSFYLSDCTCAPKRGQGKSCKGRMYTVNVFTLKAVKNIYSPSYYNNKAIGL